MRICYKNHWPAALRAILEPQLRAALALDILPGWLEDLWVYYDADDNQTPATMDVDPCYWNSKLIVTSAFMEMAPEAQAEVLVHEFFHVHTAPLTLLVRDMAEHVAETDAKLGERFKEEIRRANERATVGLEAAFARARRAA
jgi:hypothetical protein